MARRLPPEAYQFAETYHLGKPTMVYDPGFKSEVKLLSIVLGCLLIFFLPVAMCDNSFKFDFRSLLLYGIVMGAFLIASFFCFLFTIVPRISTRNFRVYVCTEGLVYKKQPEIEVVRWDEIEKVEMGTIFKMDGTQIHISRYINIGALDRNIRRKRKSYRQSLQQMRDSNADKE